MDEAASLHEQLDRAKVRARACVTIGPACSNSAFCVTHAAAGGTGQGRARGYAA
jgi:hypothetical protein